MLLTLGGQESQLKDERSKNEQLEEETHLLRRKAQLLHQVSVALKILLKFVLSMRIYLPNSSILRHVPKRIRGLEVIKNKPIRLLFCFF